MTTLLATIRTQITDKWRDSLYQNSVYLILTMAAMAGFGFIFWLINAKLFSAHDIGIATAIIPTTTMIAIGSLFGLDNSIVRFLNSKDNKGTFVRSAFLVVAILSFLGSVVFGLFSYFFSPTISEFFTSDTNYLVFVCLTIATTLNLLADAIYLANKRTVFTFLVTSFHSFLRTLIPFLFVSFGAAGILLAAAVAQLSGLCLNLIILNKIWKYFTCWKIEISTFSGIWTFTTHNYLASLFNLLPYSIVPIIIIDTIGEAEAAYFYIVTMIANLMYVIPNATTQSLFAEGSYHDTDITRELQKAIQFIAIFTIPAIITILLLADILLSFFGADYAEKGSELLMLLAISTIPYAFIIIAKAIFKVTQKSQYLLLCAVLVASLEISLVYYFINKGLTGVGYAFLISNLLIAGIASFLAIYALRTSGK